MPTTGWLGMVASPVQSDAERTVVVDGTFGSGQVVAPPPGTAAMPETGWLTIPAWEPKNGTPKLNTPPSPAPSQ